MFPFEAFIIENSNESISQQCEIIGWKIMKFKF